MSIFLLSEARLKKDFLNDNIASELILPSIQTAQDIYLRQTLGDSLLDKICNMVREDELQEPYKTLLDEYIIIYLEYLAMAELCVPSTFKLGNIGIAQAYDSNVNTSTIQNVKYLESYYKQKASFYENRLTTFIQQHCNLFPEYNTITDVTVSTESTLQCGIYLGGTSKKRTIINNSNNNNTEVGNYVRYDKAQNLSELEKAQARENIGVSANGDIVVDLENYYTKDEVFNKTEINTKLVPYITTNEVNLRLNSYYDKSQTDTVIQNAIDNIDIPDTDLSNYYTKSETYNKSEVNDLIDSVNSGEVDLTNYYKKNETYSKYEVDTLVDGVETFSGNYNDLTNKPDIYTKEQVDNLIENVDVDLSDYYTKEQVYNKQETYSVSQVDTLISQVPTFSGNYADLTNKPDVYTKAETFTRDEIVSMINEINYSDINNTPTLSTVATSGSYNDLENKPTLFSGSYTDLTNTPTIPTTTSQLQLDNVYNKSEIDLQFESVNTTLGDINNLLETI